MHLCNLIWTSYRVYSNYKFIRHYCNRLSKTWSVVQQKC